MRFHIKLVDGNDVCAVHNASKEQIVEMRNGDGPRLIELSNIQALWPC